MWMRAGSVNSRYSGRRREGTTLPRDLTDGFVRHADGPPDPTQTDARSDGLTDHVGAVLAGDYDITLREQNLGVCLLDVSEFMHQRATLPCSRW